MGSGEWGVGVTRVGSERENEKVCFGRSLDLIGVGVKMSLSVEGRHRTGGKGSLDVWVRL